MNSPFSAPQRIAEDVRAALGQVEVDLVLNGGWIVNVYSGEIHAGDVAIHRGKIVAIRERFTGPARKTENLSGKYIAPALVDLIFPKDQSLSLGSAREIGVVGNFVSSFTKELRRRETVRTFAETRQAIRNGKTAFLDERIGPWALGVLLDEVRRQGLDISPICFALDPAKPVTGNEHPVQVAMTSGFSTAQAFQLATLNPAVHYGIDDQIGSVAPGRMANLLILDDLAALRPVRILIEGEEMS